jgi:hypothetical protein
MQTLITSRGKIAAHSSRSAAAGSTGVLTGDVALRVRELIRQIADEQEGEQIADDSRFPIDTS